MKTNISAAFAAYEPVHYKTFQGALDAFFEQECPMIGGSRTRQTLVNVIYNMVLKFFPETNHLRQGHSTKFPCTFNQLLLMWVSYTSQ